MYGVLKWCIIYLRYFQNIIVKLYSGIELLWMCVLNVTIVCIKDSWLFVKYHWLNLACICIKYNSTVKYIFIYYSLHPWKIETRNKEGHHEPLLTWNRAHKSVSKMVHQTTNCIYAMAHHLCFKSITFIGSAASIEVQFSCSSVIVDKLPCHISII